MGTQRYFKLIEERENTLTVPRGFIGKLLRFCKEKEFAYEFKDERRKLKGAGFTSTIQLRDHQRVAIEATQRKDLGVIVAPLGSGKTIIGLSIVAEKQQPALIIVHRKQLAEQWMDRIDTTYQRRHSVAQLNGLMHITCMDLQPLPSENTTMKRLFSLISVKLSLR